MRNAIPENFSIRIKRVYLTGIAIRGHYSWPTESTNIQNELNVGTAAVSGKWSEAGLAFDTNVYNIYEATDKENGVELQQSQNFIPVSNTGIQFMVPGELYPPKFEGMRLERRKPNGDIQNYRQKHRQHPLAFRIDSSGI